MNFDRNTIIGFVVLAILFFGFFYYTNKQQAAAQREKFTQDSIARSKDSIAKAKLPKDSSLNKLDSGKLNTAVVPIDTDTTIFKQLPGATEHLTKLENDVMTVYFTDKGGQPKYVELKKFKGPDSALVKLGGTDFDKISYAIKSGNNNIQTSDHYFDLVSAEKNPDGSQKISFRSSDGSLVHEFVVKPDNYMIDFNLTVNHANQLLQNNTLDLIWQNKALRQQRDVVYERQQSQIGYRVDGDYDHSSALKSSSEDFKKPTNWIAVKQQFFSTTLVAKNNFTSGTVNWKAPSDSDKQTVVEATALMKMQVQLVNNNQAIVPLSIYYGPTDYKILKQYGNGMENMVNLGSGIFAFVKYINRWIIIPIFNLFSQLTSNFGIVILLLTLFIRLVISPLTYSSYLSGAKMKVLRPEIDKLKIKYNGDQQQVSVEQMKLFREAGVNPLGGCIPALLQIPIFFALYSFFNSNVALRGQSFLWAKDLSQYDSIFDFGNVPVISSIYGNHISLFTITAVLTSFLISLYSMSMTPDQNNPVLKYMPYFFPIILLFVFNKLPSGLTWYYTVSNLITLGLQFVIQNYIIDHDKILAKMEVNRKKPKTKSKFAQRLEQMQEQQKQLKESQNKNRR